MFEGTPNQTLDLRILPRRDRPPPPVLKFLDLPLLQLIKGRTGDSQTGVTVKLELILNEVKRK